MRFTRQRWGHSRLEQLLTEKHGCQECCNEHGIHMFTMQGKRSGRSVTTSYRPNPMCSSPTYLIIAIHSFELAKFSNSILHSAFQSVRFCHSIDLPCMHLMSCCHQCITFALPPCSFQFFAVMLLQPVSQPLRFTPKRRLPDANLMWPFLWIWHATKAGLVGLSRIVFMATQRPRLMIDEWPKRSYDVIGWFPRGASWMANSITTSPGLTLSRPCIVSGCRKSNIATAKSEVLFSLYFRFVFLGAPPSPFSVVWQLLRGTSAHPEAV